MSRTRNAAVMAAFAYVQYGLAIVSGLVLIPLTLRYVGARDYGLWLASGDLLAYASMVDLGVLSVLPWMLAESDGRRDREAMRTLVVNGLVVGVVVGVGYALVAGALWMVLPSALRLTTADRAIVGPPLAVLVLATMVGYPLRVFSAIIAGLQDVLFNGVLGIAQSLVTILVTIVGLWKGYGLYALAAASAGSSLVVVVASLARTVVLAPDLLTHWPSPTVRGVRMLLSNGGGVWFGAFGWQLLAASNNLVIAFIGHPEWVPVYACTAKLCLMSTQLAWVLPDSGLIGLAQLHGEQRNTGRVRQVVMAMLRLHLLLAGGAACGLLAFNPAFVTRWVGAAFFGGLSLNLVLVGGIILYSFIHGLVAAASVLGNRLQVGLVTLVNGVVQVLCAIVFGRMFGLVGIAAAGVVTGALTAIPAGVVLLGPATSMTPRALAMEVVGPWAVRIAPLAVLALATSLFYRVLGVWITAGVTAAIGCAYLWQMRPLYRLLPLEPRWTRWLVSLRLMPPIAPAVAPAEQS